MNNLLKCKLVMLPVNQKAESCLILEQGIGSKVLRYYPNKYFTREYLQQSYSKAYHLYIVSDREIKEGDWILMITNGHITRCVNTDKSSLQDWRKIEATTDYLIIPINWEEDDNVPYIPESFIQIYIKNYNLGTPIKKTYLETELCNAQGTGGCCAGQCTFIKVRTEGKKAGCVLCHQIKETFTRFEVEDVLEECLQHLVYQSNLPKITDNDSVKEWFNKNY